MSKVKSEPKSIKHCENLTFYDTVNEIHDHNDDFELKKLLDKVELWDIENPNQYKSIGKFECLVCDFKTNEFHTWKYHIMSMSHLTDCNKIKDLYSYVCSNKACKVLLYGTQNALSKHKQEKHSENSGILGVPALMAEVMKRFHTKSKPLYFCSHCKKFEETPIHLNNEVPSNNGIKVPIDFFCKFCQVTFISSPEMIDYHSLSVEHMTLKCFDVLYPKVKTKSKIVNNHEESNKVIIDDHNKIISYSDVSSESNSMKLPFIVLNRFQNITQRRGECKLCKRSVVWESQCLLMHLHSCEYINNDLTGSNNTTIKKFECKMCNFKSDVFTEFKLHVVSDLHLIKCFDTNNFYSYFCNECNILMYSHKVDIKNHWELNHKDIITTEFPILSERMANVFLDLIKNPNRDETLHYYGCDKSNKFEKIVSLPCHTCKIEFHTSIDDFNMHEVSSEHIILKFLTPKVSLTNKNSGVIKKKSNKVAKKNVPSYFFDFVQLNDGLYEVVMNRNQHNGDTTEHIALMNKESKIEKPLVNECTVQLDDGERDSDIVLSNNKAELKPTHVEKQYTKFFKHKMDMLSVLQKYIDDIFKTSSYYCNECDFMTEQKHVWDKHNQTEHTYERSTVYCSVCSLFIVHENIEEHNNSKEHGVLLQFLESLKPVEEALTNKMPMDSDRNKQFGLNNNDYNEDILNSVNLNNINFQNCNGSLNGIQNKNEDLSKFKTLLLDPFDSLNNHMDDKKSTPNVVDLNCGGNVSEESHLLTTQPMPVPCQPNVNVKTSEKMNNTDVSTITDGLDLNNLVPQATNLTPLKSIVEESKHENVSLFSETTTVCPKALTDSTKSLKNKNSCEFENDKAYGDYVTQRLIAVDDSTTKQYIKLDIDYLFCTKYKKK